MQEQLNLVLYFAIRVLQQHANVHDLSLEFEHIIKDEVSDDHESLATHMIIHIMQKHKDVLGALIQSIREAVEHIAQGYYDVCLDSKVYVSLQQVQYKIKVLLADKFRYTHVLAQCEDG